MESEELQLFEQLLQAREAQLLSQGPARVEPSRRDDVNAQPDEDEQPLTEMLQAIASGRNRAQEAELADVRRALVRLRKEPELFGLCESCEEPVGEARLKARPQARFCLPCQVKRDGGRAGHTRRKLTDYT